MGLKSCSLLAQTLLFHSPAQTTAHSPELIFHIMNSRDQTSILLSVEETVLWFNEFWQAFVSEQGQLCVNDSFYIE